MIYALNWLTTHEICEPTIVFYFLKDSIIVINIVIVTDIFRLFWLKSWLISTLRILFFQSSSEISKTLKALMLCYDPIFLSFP